MGVVQQRSRGKEERRVSIMDAAERVFFAKGYAGATMDEVAESAGLSKGLLYFYFKGKEDLCHALVHRGMHILYRLFEEVLQQHETGIEQVLALGRAYVRFSREYKDYYNLMTSFEAAPSDSLEPDSYEAACDQEGGNVIELVAQAVQNGIEDGTIRSDVNPLETAIILWGQTHGFIQVIHYKQIKLRRRHDVDPERLLETALHIMTDALVPR